MNVSWSNRLSAGPRSLKALMAAGLFLCLALLFVVPPDRLPFTTCEFHSLTGHSCLTCGMTRSLHAISHGDLIASIRYHLMGPLIFTGMVLCFIVFSLEATRGRRLNVQTQARLGRLTVLLLAIVWLTYWGARLVTEFVT